MEEKNIIKLPQIIKYSHDVRRLGACKVLMRPSIEGSVIAGGAVRIVQKLLELKMLSQNNQHWSMLKVSICA
jgi:ribosomal protein S5